MRRTTRKKQSSFLGRKNKSPRSTIRTRSTIERVRKRVASVCSKKQQSKTKCKDRKNNKVNQLSIEEAQKQGIEDLRKMSKHKAKGRVIFLFGSSVNPPTIAHVKICEYFCNNPAAAEVWVLPVYKHMFESKKNQAAFEARMAMTKLATKHLKKVKVVDLERTTFLERRQLAEKKFGDEFDEQKFKHGSYDLLKWLQEKYPNDQFRWIMGADTFLSLNKGKWRHSNDIPNVIDRFEVIVRDDEATEEELKNLPFSERAVVHNLNLPEGVSSTKARKATLLEDLRKNVSPAVAEYVQKHDLYEFDSKAV